MTYGRTKILLEKDSWNPVSSGHTRPKQLKLTTNYLGTIKYVKKITMVNKYAINNN